MRRDEEAVEGQEPQGDDETFIGFSPNIDELEILLEAYFVQIDGTLNKLSTLVRELRAARGGGGGDRGVGGGVRCGGVAGGGGREAPADAADGAPAARPPRARPGAVVPVQHHGTRARRGGQPGARPRRHHRLRGARPVVPGPRDPAVALLVRELRTRLASTSTTSPAPAPSPSPSPSPLPDGEARKDGSVSPLSRGGEGIGKDGQALGDNKALPFEFRALEVCLQFACKSLEQEVRDELEHLLDDDMDMASMHLTEKLAYQATGQSSRFYIDKEPKEFDEERDEEAVEGQEPQGDDETFIGFRPNIDELEILLEAYFVQIDGTLNKLSTLREYVDDTEDYINIMLDDKQNQLLQMGVMLSTGTLVISCAIAVTGVFGINIHISLYDAPANVFWQTTYGIIGGSVALYLIALLCYKRSGILQ